MEKVNLEIALAVRGIHTTQAFSDAVGISRQTLGPIRNGVKEATQETAEQIAKALNFTDKEFYEVFPNQYLIHSVKNGKQAKIADIVFGNNLIDVSENEKKRRSYE